MFGPASLSRAGGEGSRNTHRPAADVKAIACAAKQTKRRGRTVEADVVDAGGLAVLDEVLPLLARPVGAAEARVERQLACEDNPHRQQQSQTHSISSRSVASSASHQASKRRLPQQNSSEGGAPLSGP